MLIRMSVIEFHLSNASSLQTTDAVAVHHYQLQHHAHRLRFGRYSRPIIPYQSKNRISDFRHRCRYLQISSQPRLWIWCWVGVQIFRQERNESWTGDIAGFEALREAFYGIREVCVALDAFER